VTTSEQTNLISAILAKKLGAKQCVARVANEEFLFPENIEMFRQLGIDNLISPNKLAADEINRLVHNFQFSDVSTFEEGKISMIGLTIGPDSKLCNLQLKNMVEYPELHMVRVVAVIRDHITIIPNGSTILRNNDHIYLITDKEHSAALENLSGNISRNVKNIMILGDTPLAYLTAKVLEKEYNVTLIGSDHQICVKMADSLTNALVIRG